MTVIAESGEVAQFFMEDAGISLMMDVEESAWVLRAAVLTGPVVTVEGLLPLLVPLV